MEVFHNGLPQRPPFPVCSWSPGNVTAAESKFHWPRTVEDTKAPLFGDPQKFPYVDESQKPEEAQVQSVCRQSQACRRDYYATNDVSVARASKKTAITFAFLQRSQKRGNVFPHSLIMLLVRVRVCVHACVCVWGGGGLFCHRYLTLFSGNI